MKQPAMSKHPEGTGSYYLRVAFEGGADWQACTPEPKPLAEMIASLEEQIAWLRSLPKDGN